MPTIREELDEKAWEIRETFAYFGRAFYAASVFEVGLVHVLLWGDFMLQEQERFEATKGKDFDKERYEAKFDAFVDQHFAQTMGNLLRRIDALPYLDKDIQARVQVAKARRDFLVHHFWRERDRDFLTRDGRQKMRDELDEDAIKFRQLDIDIEEATKPLRIKLGIDDRVMDDYVAKFMESVANEPGSKDS